VAPALPAQVIADPESGLSSTDDDGINVSAHVPPFITTDKYLMWRHEEGSSSNTHERLAELIGAS
jgi:hypothetical protein